MKLYKGLICNSVRLDQTVAVGFYPACAGDFTTYALAEAQSSQSVYSNC
jgi:hypothetical protein